MYDWYDEDYYGKRVSGFAGRNHSATEELDGIFGNDNYHTWRTHLSLERDAPEPRTRSATRDRPGGLLNYYHRQAA